MAIELLQSKTLTTPVNFIEFTSIPQDGTDLLLLVSASEDGEFPSGPQTMTMEIHYNGDLGFDYYSEWIAGLGTAAGTTFGDGSANIGSNFNASTFSLTSVRILNYSSSSSMYVSESVMERNVDNARITLGCGLRDSLEPITSLSIHSWTPTYNFVVGTTASLYKITSGNNGITTASQT
jgi:hypothetical protein